MIFLRAIGLSVPYMVALMMATCAPAVSPIIQEKKRADRQVDTNRDGKPDLFEFPGRKELDLNHDGRIDIIRYYEAGKLSKEELDLDFDGRVDAIAIYRGGVLVRQELDENFDGIYESVRVYERGKLVRREVDENGKGKPTYFEFYDGNGELDRAGIDRDGDGKIDQWVNHKVNQTK